MYCFDATENQLMNPTRFRFAIAKRTVLIAAIVGVWDCWSLGLLESGQARRHRPPLRKRGGMTLSFTVAHRRELLPPCKW